MASEKYKPEWTPKDAGSEFAGRVMPGVSGASEGAGGHKARRRPPRARRLSLDDYEEGVLRGDRVILARDITLVESNNPGHFNDAQELIQRILPHTGRAIRVGITGIPGAGKSTFIEALGCYLTEEEKKVAVLAVDPSSTISGGSILGDKTRMEKLARDPRAFIRPGPTSAHSPERQVPQANTASGATMLTRTSSAASSRLACSKPDNRLKRRGMTRARSVGCQNKTPASSSPAHTDASKSCSALRPASTLSC